jgi:hypothetical protein
MNTNADNNSRTTTLRMCLFTPQLIRGADELVREMCQNNSIEG